MSALLIALFVFVVVALAAFAVVSLFDQRSAQARLIKERLANERKAPERDAEEEFALLRDEQLSRIPAFDTLLRRSARVSAIQKMLLQAGMRYARRQLSWIVPGLRRRRRIVTYIVRSKNPVDRLGRLLLSASFFPTPMSPIAATSALRRFEELFPEAIDTLARAVRAGHAFTTALEMISNEIAEPIAGEFRQLYEEQKFGMPVRDALHESHRAHAPGRREILRHRGHAAARNRRQPRGNSRQSCRT